MARRIDGTRRGALRRMVMTLALLVVGISLASAAQAQGPGGMMNAAPEERATQRLGMLTERLQLTAEQAGQIKPVLVKQFTEQSSLFQKFQAGGDRAAMMGEMQALRTKYDEQIVALLTADQKPKYALLQEEERSRRMNRGGGGGQ